MYGNNLYRVISQSINKDFLLLTDVPELVDIDNHTFNLEYSKSFLGGLFMTTNNDPYVTLENAFNETFLASDYKVASSQSVWTLLQSLCLFLMCLKFLILTHEIFMGCHVHLVIQF